MVLTADDLGIRKGLIPCFCKKCGNRVGWNEEEVYLFCEECSK